MGVIEGLPINLEPVENISAIHITYTHPGAPKNYGGVAFSLFGPYLGQQVCIPVGLPSRCGLIASLYS